MNFLDIVNKVIEESGSELDLLTVGTWNSAEAGRRLYPRIKRLVVEAWKLMQMERNEWQFKAAELHVPISAKLKFQDGFRVLGEPAPGAIFVGGDSGFIFTIADVDTQEGDWLAGDAKGQITINGTNFQGNTLIPYETFTAQSPDTGEFTYTEKGSYNLRLMFDQDMREIAWTTMVATTPGSTPVPVTYMPWDNWTYDEASFTQGSLTPPSFYSQDPFGDVVFYPQTLNDFNINFYYTKGPQTLVDPTDIPDRILEDYHEWIAWRALMNLAKYDKNPDVFSYARDMATEYKLRAERNIMPKVQWGFSKYNVKNIY